jgi:hypothetical protein
VIKKMALFAVATILFSSTGYATQEEMAGSLSDEQSCKNWAEEDGISKEGLKEYMAQCLAQFKEGETEYQESGLQEEVVIPSSESYENDVPYEDEALDPPLFDEELFEESQEMAPREMSVLPPKKKNQ